jgi:hypothetical protein
LDAGRAVRGDLNRFDPASQRVGMGCEPSDTLRGLTRMDQTNALVQTTAFGKKPPATPGARERHAKIDPAGNSGSGVKNVVPHPDPILAGVHHVGIVANR